MAIRGFDCLGFVREDLSDLDCESCLRRGARVTARMVTGEFEENGGSRGTRRRRQVF